jgi:hypothetical protein
MAHYALIDSNNIVVQVITGVDENVIQTDLDGTQVGGSTLAWERFYSSRPEFAGLKCKRTSYNNNIRKKFAGIGDTYNATFDVFIEPRPFTSWNLNYTTFKWEAPVAVPEVIEGYIWVWSEINQEWIQLAIPTE